ncbi:hypothetical protein ACFW3D_32585 [Streptomyces sp. NPDC058864]
MALPAGEDMCHAADVAEVEAGLGHHPQSEPPTTFVADQADPVARACLASGDVPLTFFGHSM